MTTRRLLLLLASHSAVAAYARGELILIEVDEVRSIVSTKQ
jgi:hypothetical protein